MGQGALIWVQHLLGSGHLRRALSVAEALADAGLATMVASGGPPMPWPAPAGVEVVQLEPLRAADQRIAGLIDRNGIAPGDDLWASRSGVLRELVDRLRPAVLITEMYPFGRRAFRHEVGALLDHAASLRPAPLVVCSVRDVLVDKVRPDRWLEMRDIARDRYDLVLVHGDAEIFPFSHTFPHAEAIADRLVYTGFVLSTVPVPVESARGSVVASAGGGAVGRRLIETALAAKPLSRLADRHWILVTGANLPEEEVAALRTGLPPGTTLERHRDDMPGLIAAAEVSVSQAGYNTVAEGLASGSRMVLVPFDGEGQTEQRVRAGRLAELGLATVLAADQLTPESLAAAVDRAASRDRPVTSSLAFDGALRSAEIIVGRLSARAT